MRSDKEEGNNLEVSLKSSIEAITKARDEAIRQIPDLVKINKDEIDRYVELRKLGYKKTVENGARAIFINVMPSFQENQKT